MELIQQIKNLPFLRLLVPLLFGILFQEYFTLSHVFSPLFIVLIFVCVIALQFNFFHNKKWRYNAIYLQGFFVFIFFFVMGAYVLSKQKELNAPYGLKAGMVATWSGVIYDYPVIQDESTRVLLRLDAKSDSGIMKTVHGNVVGFVSNSDNMPVLKPGDRLIFHTRIYKVRNAGNPEEFDFQTYFQRKGIQYLTFINSQDYIVHGKGCNFCLRRKAFEIRNTLATILEHNLEEENSSVAQAMVLGLRDSVTNTVEEGFAAAGIMHILAISGLHVGILFLVLTNLWHWVTFAKSNRLGRAIFVIFGIWGYTFLTGFPPSVVRASLMLSLFLIGDAMNRYYTAINSVLMAALILLLVNPGLLFDISFQLSFTAVLGILLLYPRFVKLINPQNIILKYFWQILCVSLSAQIGTLPVSLYYFKLFPTLFLFANLIAIPAAFIIVLGSLMMFFSSGYPLICGFIGDVVNACIEVLVKVGSFINTVFFSTIENINLSLVQSFLLYIILGSFLAFIVFKYSSYLKYTILVVLMFMLTIFDPSKKSYQNSVLLNHEPQIVFVAHNTEKVLTFTQDSLDGQLQEDMEYVNTYYSRYLKKYSHLPTKKYTIMSINQKQEYGSFFPFGQKINIPSSKKLYTKTILIMGKQPPSINTILEYIDLDQVIFHSSVPYYYAEKQKKICDEMKLVYHDLAFDGAYWF